MFLRKGISCTNPDLELNGDNLWFTTALIYVDNTGFTITAIDAGLSTKAKQCLRSYCPNIYTVTELKMTDDA